jgi:hypothetical protein
VSGDEIDRAGDQTDPGHDASQAPEPPAAPPPAPPPPALVPPSPFSPAPPSPPSFPPAGAPPGPVWQWTVPEEPRGPTVGGLIRGAFRLYRAAFSSLFGLALVQQAIQVVLLIPTFLIASRAVTQMFDLLGRTTFPRGGSYDEVTAFQERFQAQVQAAVMPDPGLAVLNALASGLGVPIGLVFLALFTAVGLATIDGRSDSVSAALRAVSARLTSFVVPGVILGLGVVILSLPYGLNQSAFSGAGRTPEGARLGLVLSAVSILVVIAVFYFVVRWSLAIPAMLTEGIGIRAGLRRSSELTQGMRLRIFGAILVVGLTFFVIELIGLVIALIIGVSTGSVVIGVATGAVLLLALIVALAPFIPALTVVAYRARVPASPDGTAPPEPAPAEPADNIPDPADVPPPIPTDASPAGG